MSPAAASPIGQPLIARRDLMLVGAGAAAANLATTSAARAAAATAMPSRAELFVFPAPDAAAVVFATSFRIAPSWARSAPMAPVRIHASSCTWVLRDNDLVSTAGGGARVYAGRVGPTDRQHYLAVVLTPTAALPKGRLAVWAEVLGASGERLRIGNPIVAEMLDRDPELARVFHRADPTQDRALFTDILIERLADRFASEGPLSPRLHAERLADLLLPDVLPFDPSLPVGFTFAGQNGRRPSDPVGDIANTVLAGMVSNAPSEATALQPAKAFPYFQAVS